MIIKFKDGILQLFPMVWAVLALIVGVLLGEVLRGFVPWWLWLAGMATAVITVLLVPGCQAKNILVLLACLLLGGTVMAIKILKSNASLPLQPIIYKAVVVSQPQRHGKVVKFDMVVSSGSMKGRKVRASLLCDTLTHRYRHLRMGSGLMACSQMESFAENSHVGHFDYARYMRCNGFEARTFIYYRNWADIPADYRCLTFWQRAKLKSMMTRERLLAEYRDRGLSGQDYAVVAAMSLGDRSMLSKTTREAYSDSGSSHVLAISGLHLAILYTMFSLLIGRRKWILSQAVMMLAVWAFVFLAGMSAGMVRSAVMISIYSLCCVLGRDRISLNSLAVAAFFMLLVNPLYLWDISFQMSFMAVAGIMLLYKPFFNLLGSHMPMGAIGRWSWGLVVTSLSSQLAVAPLSAYYFGQFPVCFLLANFIAIPGVWLLLHIVILFWICQPLAAVQQVLVDVLGGLASLMKQSLGFISQLPGACVNGIDMSQWQLAAVYLAEAGLLLAFFFVVRVRRQITR